MTGDDDEAVEANHTLDGCRRSFFHRGMAAHQTHAQKKQQMLQDWQKNTGKASLPVVKDLIDRGQIADAKKMLKETCKSNPDIPEVYFLIARVHLAEGRDQLALEALEKTLELDDQQDEAWFTMGLLTQEKNDLEKALACYERALRLQPVKVEYIMAMVHIYNMQGLNEKAVGLLEEKRQRLPYQNELILALADIAQKNGDVPQAVRLYKEAASPGQ